MESDEKPMSEAFRLQCADVDNDKTVDSGLRKKWAGVAGRVAKIIQTAQLKHKTAYKNTSYWASMDVKYPLESYDVAIRNTKSSVDTYQWIAPKTLAKLAETVLSTCRELTIRLFVEIPSELFGKRDFLNVTYACKRAHYACSIAFLIRTVNVPEIESISFVPGGQNDDDYLFPDILLKNAEKNLMIRISLHNKSIAKPQRYLPALGNLRPATVFEESRIIEDRPTPRFNQRVLESMLEMDLRSSIENELNKLSVVVQSLGLVRRFLCCRGLDSAALLVSARVLKLTREKTISETQEILTVLRIIFRDILSWDHSKVEKLSQATELTEDVTGQFLNCFPVNFLDDSGYWNIAHSQAASDIVRLKEQVEVCFPLLGDLYNFDHVFINKVPAFSQFDQYARMTVTAAQLRPLINQFATDVTNSGDLIRAFIWDFRSLIEKAMAERFEYLKFMRVGDFASPWDVNCYAKNVDVQSFVIGFRTTKQWSNPLTIGPVAQSEEAKEFRDFWKNATELRKFADTRICECMVWAKESSQDVSLSVLQFILQRKYGVHVNVSWRSWNLASMVTQRLQFEAVEKAFASLGGVLRSLKNLPLMITNVHGISPFIRSTEPCSPSIFAPVEGWKTSEDHKIPTCSTIPYITHAVTVHLKLEYSGKWGSDIEAIRRLTSSFYIQIAEKLREKHKLLAVPTVDQLFVVQDGIVFKLVIVHDKILKVLEDAVTELRESGATRIENSIPGMRLSAWKKKFVTDPLLQLSLQSFSTSHSVFGATVQLLKIWLGSKMLSGTVNDLVVELLAAAAIEQKGFSPPESAWSAFVRVLRLLVSHNWLMRPLIVDLLRSWNDKEISKLEADFVKMRPVLPPMVVITNVDPVGSKFTKDSPSPMVLKRILGLASATLRILEKNVFDENPINIKNSLFCEDYSIYDAVFDILPSASVRRDEFKEVKQHTHKALPVVEFDPVDELIYQLNNNFGNVALFFYNKYSGSKIGVKFKPQEEVVPSKVTRCNLHKRFDDARLKLNVDEILEGILILGQGIIKSPS